MFYIIQGKLKAYQDLSHELDKNISEGISQDNLTFIRIVDDKGKQHLFPIDKIDYVNSNAENLTIHVIVESGESYGIFFEDDEKFQFQLDYLHRQLNIQ